RALRPTAAETTRRQFSNRPARLSPQEAPAFVDAGSSLVAVSRAAVLGFSVWAVISPQLRGSMTTPPAAFPDTASDNPLAASERLWTTATGIVNPRWTYLLASCSRIAPFGLT